jgi:N-acyl-L-homoserine lactone synthetase
VRSRIPFRPQFSLRQPATGKLPAKLEILSQDEDKRELYGVRYRAYLAAGLIKPDSSEVYCDRFDREPTTLAVGIFEQGRCIGSMRLSFLEEAMSEGKLPCEEVYPEVARIKARSRGTLVELSRLGLEPSIRNRSYRTTVTAALVRAAIMACMAADVNVALAATRTQWVRFYQYMMGFKVVAGPSRYPPGDVPVYLMCVNFREVADRRARHNVFFRISPAEVAQMRAVMEPMMTWRRGAGAETAA